MCGCDGHHSIGPLRVSSIWRWTTRGVYPCSIHAGSLSNDNWTWRFCKIAVLVLCPIEFPLGNKKFFNSNSMGNSMESHGVFICFCPRGMRIPWSISHGIPQSLHGLARSFRGISWSLYGVWIIKLVPICRENPWSISYGIPWGPRGMEIPCGMKPGLLFCSIVLNISIDTELSQPLNNSAHCIIYPCNIS